VPTWQAFLFLAAAMQGCAIKKMKQFAMRLRG
jgi:hypothetical protein